MNSLNDLNMLLHNQLERLDDPELTIESVEKEVKRTQAIAAVSDQLIKLNMLALKMAQVEHEREAYPKTLQQLAKGDLTHAKTPLLE